MVAAICPTREMLLHYSIGTLSDEQSDDLAGHLDSCPDCQATIVTLEDAEDTLIGRLRTPLGSEPCLTEPEFQAAVAHAIAMPAGTGVSPVPPGDEGNPASAMPHMLGEYQILEELGRGGMGRVYKALHTKLDRVVAVKVLPRGRLEDPQAIARFEREMKAVGRLAHPNIVQAYDAREIDGTPVLVMEFVDGLDLAELVRRVGPLPVAEACELVRQTALGLQRAHEHGLVHRDIKPSNIMLTGTKAESGQRKADRTTGSDEPLSALRSPLSAFSSSLAPPQVKLLDLGLARFYAEASGGEEMTGTGQAMGTADYMAPEQASDSRTVDIRADIYSLGCTLYKLLSGRAPFSGPEHRGTLDKMNAQVHQAPPPVRQFAPDVPEELAAILDRMLAKDPNDRFATPAEVAAVLEPFCAGANLLSLWETVRARDEQVESGPLSLGERVRADEAPVGSPAPIPRRSTIKTLLIGLAFLGAMAAAFAAGVLITIKINGEKYQVEVPKDSHTVVDDSGNVTVNIPGKPEGGKASAVSPAAEFQALQGRWNVVRVEKGKEGDSSWARIIGGDFGEENPAAFDRLHFTDNRLSIKNLKDGSGTDWDYRIDPTATPKTIDLLQNGPMRGLGVYEMHGDRLTICLAKYLPSLKTDQRPKRLAVEPDSGDVLFVLQRHRLSADEKALEGFWVVASQVDDGKRVPEEKLRGRSCSFYDDSMSVGCMTADGKHDNVLFGPYELDPTKHPKTIRIIAFGYESGKFERRELLGIYQIDGDRLSIAYRKGASPPEKFESLPGSGVTLLVLRKKEPGAGTTLFGAEAAKPKQVSDGVPDEKAIQGTWEIASSTFSLVSKLPYEKEIAPEQVLKTAKVVITADTLKIVGQHVTDFAFQYRLNPAAKNKMIDLQTPGPTFGLVSYGIYQLEGDQLKICASGLRSPGDTTTGSLGDTRRPDARVLRPAELWAEFGSGKELLVLRRVADAAIAEDEKAIQGTWRVEEASEAIPVSGFDSGQQISFSRRTIAVRARGGMNEYRLEFAYALDPTARPKRIDIATLSAPDIVQPVHGVYELEGDRLTICWAASPGGGAGGGVVRIADTLPPSKLAAGPNTALVVLKRVPEGSDKGPSRDTAYEKPAQQPAVTPAVSPAATPAVSPAAELKALQGQWKVVRVERGKDADTSWDGLFGGLSRGYRAGRGSKVGSGGRSSLDGAVMDRFQFREGYPSEELWITWFNAQSFPTDGQQRFVCRLDLTASPKTMDLLERVPSRFGGGAAQGPPVEQLAVLGIYEIEGDRLRICLARHYPSVTSDQRPRTFAIGPGSEGTLFVLERYRPSEEVKAIAGAWTVSAQVEDGKPVPEEKLRGRTCFFGDPSVSIVGGTADGKSDVVLQGRYVLDGAKQPKTILITSYYDHQTEKLQKREFLGIYELDGDRLSIAYRQGGSRPEKLESLPGSGVTLLVLQRREEQKAASSPKPDKAEARQNPSRQTSNAKAAQAPGARAE